MARLSRVLYLSVFAALLSSCSVWDSVTAYFNTYYNAERLFTEAEDEIWTQPTVRFSGRDYLSTIVATPATRTKLNSVIEKCSKLLTDHPESGLVDNCLMYIGKCFFYQGEFQRAERKFLELLEGYPESDLVPEARMLLAYTFYKAGDREGAQKAAEALTQLAEKIDEPWLAARASAILGQLAIDREDYETATRFLHAAVEDEPVREQRVTLYLKLADLYELINEPGNALEAYNEAADQSTDYMGEYKGMIGSCRMMIELGEYADAADRLDELRSNSNFREFYGEIDLTMGDDYRASGDLQEAMLQYQYVDTAYARTEASAKAIFELGRMYEEDFRELDSARTTFTRGRTAFPQAEITKEIIRRADYMNRYFTLRSDVEKYDSMLVALDAPPPDTVRVDTTAQDSVVRKAPVQPAMPRDTIKTRLADSMNELAGIFFIDMDWPDSAAVWYRAVAERFPDNRMAPYAMFALAQIYDQDSTISRSVPDSIRREIIARFPRTEFARESRRLLGLPAVTIAANPAEEMYDRAEERYLSGEYGTAASSFKDVAAEYPESRYAARAEYAAGFIYENNLFLGDSALAAYQRLVQNYPSSPFVARVRPKIQYAEAEAKRVADSLAALRVPDSLGTVLTDSLGRVLPDSLGRVLTDSLGRVLPDSLQRVDSLATQVPDSVQPRPSSPAERPQGPPSPTGPGKDVELPGRPKP